MKIKFDATKADLDAALQVVQLGVSGDDDAKMEAHVVFRSKGGAVEVLASNGSRLFACTPLKVSSSEGEGGFSMTGRRLQNFLGVVDDDSVITLEHDGGITKVAGLGVGGKVPSLDPANFPYWDGTFAEAKLTVQKFPSARLAAAFAYAKKFTADNDNRAPAMVPVEARAGTICATDSVAVTLLTVKGLENSQLRIHSKDVPDFVAFLTAKGVDTVDILEHDRCVFIRRADGALVGATRWPHAVPNIKIPKDGTDTCWFSVKKADLERAFRILSVFSDKNEPEVGFHFDGSRMVLSSKAATGSAEPETFAIPCEQENMKALTESEYKAFRLGRTYLEHLLSAVAGDDLKLGVNWTKKNGYCRFRMVHEGDDYTTVIVWAPQK